MTFSTLEHIGRRAIASVVVDVLEYIGSWRRRQIGAWWSVLDMAVRYITRLTLIDPTVTPTIISVLHGRRAPS